MAVITASFVTHECAQQASVRSSPVKCNIQVYGHSFVTKCLNKISGIHLIKLLTVATKQVLYHCPVHSNQYCTHGWRFLSLTLHSKYEQDWIFALFCLVLLNRTTTNKLLYNYYFISSHSVKIFPFM